MVHFVSRPGFPIVVCSSYCKLCQVSGPFYPSPSRRIICHPTPSRRYPVVVPWRVQSFIVGAACLPISTRRSESRSSWCHVHGVCAWCMYTVQAMHRLLHGCSLMGLITRRYFVSTTSRRHRQIDTFSRMTNLTVAVYDFNNSWDEARRDLGTP